MYIYRLMQEFFLAVEKMPSLFHSTREGVTVLSRAAIGQSAYAAVCKIMEKLVHSQFFAYLKINNLHMLIETLRVRYLISPSVLIVLFCLAKKLQVYF